MYVVLVVAIFFLITGSVGCSPLQKAIKEVAPSYEAKQPALNTSGLAHRLLDGKMDINECYIGQPGIPSTGWSAIKLTYKGNAQADLTLDFGKTINATASANGEINSDIVLDQISEEALNSLSFNVDSACLADPATMKQYMDSGVTDQVIVRALKASRIQITDNDTVSAKLNVNVPIGSDGVGGSLTGSSTNTRTWDGTSLFFAHQVEKFLTKLERQTYPNIPVGGSTSNFETCTFSLDGVNLPTKAWSGTLNCLGGSTTLAGSFNGYKGKSSNGVTYAITVKSTSPGLFQVEMNKITVQNK